ncbi:MAG: C39 family peptidase [Caldilineaceae bacterium]
MLLSNFRHRRQQHRSDCLVACADMVLNHLGLSIGYDRLAKLLRAGESFTPFSRLRYLESLGLFLEAGERGDLSIFTTYIALGLPIIVGVKTLNWSHWGTIITDHAVVVIGIDQEHDTIYINDPFFVNAPIEMSLIEFEIGWEEKDRQYAIIGLAPL